MELKEKDGCASVTGDECYYCIVNNIPESFHASDLRNYFSSFIEQGKFDCFHFRHRPQFICNQADADEGEGNVGKTKEGKTLEKIKKLCCIVRFTNEDSRSLFIKRHHNKFWMDKDGNDINQRCVINRVKLDPSDEEKFAKELRPPKFMPEGNVGTKNSYFLELIRQCRLPPSLIQKLGLNFPVARRYKKYSKVPLDYKTTVADVETKEEDEEIVTGKGHSISDVYVDNSGPAFAETDSSKASRGDSDESGPDDDDDRCEDWERHVTFEDDPTSQERIKERLFEDEIELVWEKGGPGIVWYTDAQFWNEQRGGFDEKTADNLDVDMEGYFTPGEGDKDARDLLDMRRNNRFHKGLDDVSVFKRPAIKPKTLKPKLISAGDNGSTKIGEFEKYTKGIGRKVMEKMGWKEGTGLGKSFVGMTQALDNEGQAPRDKRGIGFFGDNIEFKRQKKTHLPEPYDDEHKVSIGTIYDNPVDLDTEESLLRSNSISYIKRYQ